MNGEGRFIQSFQGVRGYAIFLIFLSHCDFGGNRYGVNRTSHLGGLGVELFILLSGYLLMQRHSADRIILFPYFKKKLKKFYPLHLMTLILAIPFAIKALCGLEAKAWKALGLNFFLLQAWSPDRDIYFSYNAVSWYLSLTMFFVFISPAVVKFWNAIRTEYVLYMMLGLFSLEIMLCVFCGNMGSAHWIVYVLPPTRSIDYILGGGAVEAWKVWNSNEQDGG